MEHSTEVHTLCGVATYVHGDRLGEVLYKHVKQLKNHEGA